MKLSTRMTLAMVGLVSLTTVALGVLTYYNVVALVLPGALERMQTHARLTAMMMDASLRGARADTMSAQASSVLRSLMLARLQNPPGAQPTAEELDWRQRLELRFAAELAGKPDYAQIRVIGAADGGMEMIRVDRSGPDGEIRIVPQAELTRRGDRGYVRDGLAAPPNQVLISSVQLNKTATGVEIPYVPTVRTVAPIHTPEGVPFAVLVINIDLRPAIAQIRASVSGGNTIYVVNDRGDYLVHPDPSREFGFDLGKPSRIQDDFPGFAALLDKPEAQPRVMQTSAGEFVGLAWAWVQLAGGPRVAMVEAAPYASMISVRAAVSNSTLIGGSAAVLCAMLLAVALSRSLTRPLVRITRAVERFSSGKVIALEPGGGREISVLAEAFARMREEAQRKSSALNDQIEERSRLADVLNNTIHNMVDPVLVADASGHVIITNPAARKVFGTLSGIGDLNTTRSFDRFYPDGTPLPEEMSPLLRAHRGETIDNFEFIVQHEDSTSKTYLVASGRPLRNEAGELQGAVTVYHDITVKKEAQSALSESERMSRAIIDSALDAFVQIDAAGRVTEWSPHAEAMFGWTRDEVIGQSLGSLIFTPEQRSETQAGYKRFNEAIDRGRPGYRVEIEAIRRDGSSIQIEVAMTALQRNDGYVMNAFMRDLSDRIVSEEQLRQAQKMESIGQLTGGIAHDFNNMLTVITGTIDILGGAVADKPQLAAIVRLISEAADRGAELTRHLLAFARKQPLQPCDTDINVVLTDLQRLLRPTLGEQIEILVPEHQAVWPIFVDRAQLEAALVNLAVNARDAMPNGGRLSIETANVVLDPDFAQRIGELEPGDYVSITVADTGNGIPDAIRAKVFDPFFTTKEVGKGTGLGLSMVYGFIKQSGGHIALYSEVGLGTTFRIYLPRATVESQRIEPALPETAPVGGTETILIVEDDALVRNYVTAQLKGLGYTTLSAANAAAALEISAKGTPFDLLFTDIVMPGKMNGVQLTAEMTKQHPSLKVLFTSGYSENAVIHNNRLDPEILLLTKPYRRSDLARMVRLALSAEAASAPSFDGKSASGTKGGATSSAAAR